MLWGTPQGYLLGYPLGDTSGYYHPGGTPWATLEDTLGGTPGENPGDALRESPAGHQGGPPGDRLADPSVHKCMLLSPVPS